MGTVREIRNDLAKNRINDNLKKVTFDSFEELHNFLDATHEVTLRSLEKIFKREGK